MFQRGLEAAKRALDSVQKNLFLRMEIAQLRSKLSQMTSERSKLIELLNEEISEKSQLFHDYHELKRQLCKSESENDVLRNSIKKWACSFQQSKETLTAITEEDPEVLGTPDGTHGRLAIPFDEDRSEFKRAAGNVEQDTDIAYGKEDF